MTPADRRLLRIVAPIALEHGVEADALQVCRYAGRVHWTKCKGALVRQRFVDALDRRGIGESAVPPRWQHLRRSEAVRIDRAGAAAAPPPAAPPAALPERREPERIGAVLTDFRELLRLNGVQLENKG